MDPKKPSLSKRQAEFAISACTIGISFLIVALGLYLGGVFHLNAPSFWLFAILLFSFLFYLFYQLVKATLILIRWKKEENRSLSASSIEKEYPPQTTSFASEEQTPPLSICPNCGYKGSPSETICPICGKKMKGTKN